ncbi:MAG TPA: esterase-like activity of phytase family protein, partial [Thermoanaerobaculia bacterium]
MSPRRGALWLALTLAAGSCAPHALAPPAEPPLSLLGSGPLIVPFGATVGGFRVGGLSGLARAADGTYLAVVDNEGETPARVFRLAFTVSENGVAPLPGKTPLQVPLAAIPLAGLDGRNFDGEGLALEPSGEMLISSETEPSIREVSLDGRTLRSLPVPDLFLGGTPGRGIRSNLGFESLTLAPGGNVLWTANERALQQDAPEDLARPSPVRLLRYEKRNGGFMPGAQFVYEVEPLQQKAGAGFKIRGLSDLLALPGGDLLAL